MHGAGGREATKRPRGGSSVQQLAHVHGGRRRPGAPAAGVRLRPPARAALPWRGPRGAGGAGRLGRERPQGRSAEANQNTPRPDGAGPGGRQPMRT